MNSSTPRRSSGGCSSGSDSAEKASQQLELTSHVDAARMPARFHALQCLPARHAHVLADVAGSHGSHLKKRQASASPMKVHTESTITSARGNPSTDGS